MIAVIAKKEALETFRDGRFRWASVGVLLLVTVAFTAGALHIRRVEAERDAASMAERRVWTEQGDKNPHSAAHFGNWAFKPVSPLSTFDPGVTRYTGTAVFMEGHKVQDARFRPIDDASGAARLGELTAAAALQWLLPLLIILLAFGAFSRERELGTLRQLMSLGVSPRVLVAGKALGLALPLAALMVPATALGVGALLLSGSPEGLVSRAPQAALLVVVYLLYFAIVAGLALWVSAMMRTSRAALLLLLAFWFTNAFIAPRLAHDIAGAVHPGPDPVAFRDRVEEVRLEAYDQWESRGEAITKRLMAEHGVDDASELPVNVGGINLLEAEEAETEAYRALHAEAAQRLATQNAVAQAGAFFAPLLAVRSLSMSLSSTDLAHHRHFADSAEDYRLTFVQFLNRDLADNAKPGAEWDNEYTVGAEMWESIPEYAYANPGLSWSIARQGPALLALGLWALIVAILLPRAVGAIDVRET
ncbi:MAG: DUF3526 domain-containing protein [Myxococcota bacterium]